MHSSGDIQRKTPELFLYQAVNMFIVAQNWAVLNGGEIGFDFSGASLMWHNEELQFWALWLLLPAAAFCFGLCVDLF